MSHKVFVSSEIEVLKRVIVYRPDSGIARISPRRAEELLFDDIVHARVLLDQFERKERLPQDIENTIITLPSNELSRARGGSHCMTCPIERA